MKSLSSIHTFSVCAYKESPYLEDCIQSLLKQHRLSKIIMVTSTPNTYIEQLAQKYQLPLYVNPGESGIVQDWNFAYHCAKTKFVTIVHQDDVYYPEYSEHMIRELLHASNPLIGFTDYEELREGKRVPTNRLLKVKRLMLIPLKPRLFQKSRFIRRRVLSLGNPICCPSVTFAKDNLPTEVFQVGFRSDEDWEAWEFLSKIKGDFIYISNPGMAHRIHEDSETSLILADNARKKEDYIMFRKFWPGPIARLLVKLYGTSEDSNTI